MRIHCHPVTCSPPIFKIIEGRETAFDSFPLKKPTPTVKYYADTAILIIIEGQLYVFQRFSSSELVLKSVENRFMTLNYYENGSRSSTETMLQFS
jgi:hypothetical protein